MDAKEGTLADVGGSYGFVCVERYRNMAFVVQDLSRIIETALRSICKDE